MGSQWEQAQVGAGEPRDSVVAWSRLTPAGQSQPLVQTQG